MFSDWSGASASVRAQQTNQSRSLCSLDRARATHLPGALFVALGTMNQRLLTYGGLTAVFLLSTVLALLLPIGDLLRSVTAFPAVLALLGALFQILRDQSAFERQLLFQQQQQAFGLGATSHMANVAFDKHAEFCDKYVAEVHQMVFTLFREGPTQEALKHVSNFADLRRQYAAWLPRDVIVGLEPFESAVAKIGSNSYLVAALQGTGDPAHGKAIAEMYATFRDVMGIRSDEPVEGRPEVAVEAVKERIRAVLDIEKLTTIRRKLIEQALKSV